MEAAIKQSKPFEETERKCIIPTGKLRGLYQHAEQIRHQLGNELFKEGMPSLQELYQNIKIQKSMHQIMNKNIQRTHRHNPWNLHQMDYYVMERDSALQSKQYAEYLLSLHKKYEAIDFMVQQMEEKKKSKN